MQAKTLVTPSMPAKRLFAAGLLLALAGAFGAIAHAQTPGTPPTPAGRAFAHGGHGGPGDGRMLERMLDGVNASPEQRSRIHDIMKSARADLHAQRQAAGNQREQLMTLFAQPTVDARAVEAARQQMMQQHDQSSRRWMQAMLDASAVLTPEQRAQLAERMKQRRDMMQRHQQERRTLEQPKG
jgi:Spy/CpxP family protein refolding chaperone